MSLYRMLRERKILFLWFGLTLKLVKHKKPNYTYTVFSILASDNPLIVASLNFSFKLMFFWSRPSPISKCLTMNGSITGNPKLGYPAFARSLSNSCAILVIQAVSPAWHLGISSAKRKHRWTKTLTNSYRKQHTERSH